MKHEAIYALYPNVVKIVHDVPYDINDNVIEIDESAVNAWQDPDQYKYDRQKAYASLEEQLDMQYWDKVNNTNTWKEHIDSVKNKYPKGE